MARAHARPRCEVGSGWEAAHIRTDLGQQDLGCSPSHTRDNIESFNRRLETGQPFSHLRAYALDRLVQIVNMRELLGDDEALVGSEVAGQRPLELWDLLAHAPASELSQRGWVVIPGDQAFEHLPR